MESESIQKVVLATRNRGKQAEFQSLLGGRFELITLEDLDIPSPAEDGLTFIENAVLKARHASRESGLPAIADDSGLCVDALDGAPGIYSARYAGADATDNENNERLLIDLEGVSESDRTARFHCTLVSLRHADDPEPLISQGVWQGKILFEPRGENGFGYDPLFWSYESECASAELSMVEKRLVSHRGRATAELIPLINKLV